MRNLLAASCLYDWTTAQSSRWVDDHSVTQCRPDASVAPGWGLPSCAMSTLDLWLNVHSSRCVSDCPFTRALFWPMFASELTMVTFYDPWPAWPISQLNRDSWPMTHDYSPVTDTVWRLCILGRGKEVSMRFRFHTVPTPSPRCTMNKVHIS